MLTISYFKPFMMKRSNNTLYLQFAYQYLSIVKEEEVFHFIPIEGKEILIDINTKQVINLSEVFVFQKGKRFIRLPVYQFLLITNASDYLNPIIEKALGENDPYNSEKKREDGEIELEEELEEKEEDVQDTHELLHACVEQNLRRLIDKALDEKNETLFKQLTTRLHEKTRTL